MYIQNKTYLRRRKMKNTKLTAALLAAALTVSLAG